MTQLEQTRRTVRIPAEFIGAQRRADRSVSLKFVSSMELSTPDFAALDMLSKVKTPGWLLFCENELNLSDVPTSDAPSDGGKTASQRLRACLFIAWRDNTDQSEPFEAYRLRRMEQMINVVKEELA